MTGPPKYEKTPGSLDDARVDAAADGSADEPPAPLAGGPGAALATTGVANSKTAAASTATAFALHCRPRIPMCPLLCPPRP
jgi:hypothetical protein